MCVPFWGAPDGAVPGRSFPHRLKAPLAGRRDRHPLAGQDAPPLLVRIVPRAQPHRASWHLIKGAPVRDAHGRLSMVINIMEDVSELKHTELAQRQLAETLEASLLPADLPRPPGWKTATLYRPCGDGTSVGGDFYDVFPIGAGGWMLVVGDVAGHGVEAAALTALARCTLRIAATVTGDPVRAIAKLNRELVGRSTLSLCTAGCVVLRDTAGRARADVICAGHPRPLLIRGGKVSHFGKFGRLPGVDLDGRWTPASVPLYPGDTRHAVHRRRPRHASGP